MTGFQEIKKFQKHLLTCKKNPKRHVIPARVNEDGFLENPVNLTCSNMLEALQIRHDSGQ